LAAGGKRAAGGFPADENNVLCALGERRTGFSKTHSGLFFFAGNPEPFLHMCFLYAKGLRL